MENSWRIGCFFYDHGMNLLQICTILGFTSIIFNNTYMNTQRPQESTDDGSIVLPAGNQVPKVISEVNE
jgi:hypothetical protein